MEFKSFPKRNDALLSTSNNVEVEASGSIGLFHDGKCHQTTPNSTIFEDKKIDWCSNIIEGASGKPWISFSLKNQAMKLTSYSVRSGCCWYSCCCVNENDGSYKDIPCCCELYSFSLQGSNDNKTWTILHQVAKDSSIEYCEDRTFELKTTNTYKYVRFVQDEKSPYCPYCMQLNQIELYGTTTGFVGSYDSDSDEGDESVSIIGKLNRNKIE